MRLTRVSLESSGIGGGTGGGSVLSELLRLRELRRQHMVSSCFTVCSILDDDNLRGMYLKSPIFVELFEM